MNELKLGINYKSGSLTLEYKDHLVGVINSDGFVTIANDKKWYSRWVEWIKDGKPTNHTFVEWRGGNYWISPNFNLIRTDIEIGIIINIETLTRPLDCMDRNIMRNIEGRAI